MNDKVPEQIKQLVDKELETLFSEEKCHCTSSRPLDDCETHDCGIPGSDVIASEDCENTFENGFAIPGSCENTFENGFAIPGSCEATFEDSYSVGSVIAIGEEHADRSEPRPNEASRGKTESGAVVPAESCQGRQLEPDVEQAAQAKSTDGPQGCGSKTAVQQLGAPKSTDGNRSDREKAVVPARSSERPRSLPAKCAPKNPVFDPDSDRAAVFQMFVSQEKPSFAKSIRPNAGSAKPTPRAALAKPRAQIPAPADPVWKRRAGKDGQTNKKMDPRIRERAEKSPPKDPSAPKMNSKMREPRAPSGLPAKMARPENREKAPIKKKEKGKGKATRPEEGPDEPNFDEGNFFSDGDWKDSFFGKM